MPRRRTLPTGEQRGTRASAVEGFKPDPFSEGDRNHFHIPPPVCEQITLELLDILFERLNRHDLFAELPRVADVVTDIRADIDKDFRGFEKGTELSGFIRLEFAALHR
jgi:hypothetical protein